MKCLLGLSTEEPIWKIGLSDLEPRSLTVDVGDLGGPGGGSETQRVASHNHLELAELLGSSQEAPRGPGLASGTHCGGLEPWSSHPGACSPVGEVSRILYLRLMMRKAKREPRRGGGSLSGGCRPLYR